jgi:hypothetical protein
LFSSVWKQKKYPCKSAIDVVRSKQNNELNELVWRLAASEIFYLESLQQKATLLEGISEHQL